MRDQTAVRRIAELINRAEYTIAFTGAGISTPSGIPDFRSEKSGMWQDNDPMMVASLFGFRQNPAHFFKWVYPLADCILRAEPNAAHRVLANLAESGRLNGIITQNIDMLHTRAGNSCVYELHGHLRTATCIHCFRSYDATPLLEKFLLDEKIPLCEDCNHVIKPDVILFGEQLPYEALRLAKQEARRCDLMIVIGSSLEVAPADELPALAKRNGAKLVIINMEATHVDTLADVVLHDDAAIVLPAVLHEMEKQP